MLYESDSHKLVNRSVTGMKSRARNSNGTTKTYSAKPALTPEKLKAVRSYYNARIQVNCVESTEFGKRISDQYFNKLLNSALSNQVKKSKLEFYDVVELDELPECI